MQGGHRKPQSRQRRGWLGSEEAGGGWTADAYLKGHGHAPKCSGTQEEGQGQLQVLGLCRSDGATHQRLGGWEVVGSGWWGLWSGLSRAPAQGCWVSGQEEEEVVAIWRLCKEGQATGSGSPHSPTPRGPMGFPAAGVTAKRRGQTKISAGGGSDRQGRGRGDRKLPGEQGRLHFQKGAGRQQEEWRDGPA